MGGLLYLPAQKFSNQLTKSYKFKRHSHADHVSAVCVNATKYENFLLPNYLSLLISRSVVLKRYSKDSTSPFSAQNCDTEMDVLETAKDW